MKVKFRRKNKKFRRQKIKRIEKQENRYNFKKICKYLKISKKQKEFKNNVKFRRNMKKFRKQQN